MPEETDDAHRQARRDDRTAAPGSVPVLESAMESGQDDEPEMTIGDKIGAEDDLVDSVEEAAELLGEQPADGVTRQEKK